MLAAAAVGQASFIRRTQQDRDEVMSLTTSLRLKNVLHKLLWLHFKEGDYGCQSGFSELFMSPTQNFKC